jgi:two-component system cell cycle sensor histidine kinase/response regulator CckA
MASKSSNELPEENRHPVTALLADDEAMVMGPAKLMLERLGFAVITAANGKIAVKLYREKKEEIALVILDLTMPIMDGEEACRLIREIDPGVPVIISSGYTEQEVSTRLSDLEGIGFIQKPYDMAMLKETVQAFTEDRSS